MALHPQFPTSPYAPLVPEQRWFPADEALRSVAYWRDDLQIADCKS